MHLGIWDVFWRIYCSWEFKYDIKGKALLVYDIFSLSLIFDISLLPIWSWSLFNLGISLLLNWVLRFIHQNWSGLNQTTLERKRTSLSQKSISEFSSEWSAFRPESGRVWETDSSWIWKMRRWKFDKWRWRKKLVTRSAASLYHQISKIYPKSIFAKYKRETQIERNTGRDWDRGFELNFGVFIWPDGRK